MEFYDPSTHKVLVTGASGFIAGHCLIQLLQQGYQVRGTLRSLAGEEALREKLAPYGAVDDKLEIVTADLLADEGWAEAVSGCDLVLHTASPLPLSSPKDENELIRPAVEGTQRVLQAAVEGGVRRVVLTSSVAAVSAGHDRRGKVFDEQYWSDTSADISAYAKSKTLAERAAWDFMANLPQEVNLELSAINPVVVIGPLLDKRLNTSGEVIYSLLSRKFPGCSRIGWGFVDVRDVAAAHLSAMTNPEAAGKRFVCTNEFLWLQEVALILNEHFAPKGYPVPTRRLPDIAIRTFALFDDSAKAVVGSLGKRTEYSNELLKTTLNWQPRPIEESIIDMGESMVQLASSERAAPVSAKGYERRKARRFLALLINRSSWWQR